MPTINQHFNGQNPLSYLGVVAFEPTDFIAKSRDPLTTDFRNVFLGTWWLNTNTNNLFYLANLNNNVATWIKLFTTSTLTTITGDTGGAVGPDSLSNINILGASSITIDGSPSSHTLTLNSSTVPIQYITDSGTATPSAGILNIVGGLNINTVGSGNTVTIKTPSLSEGVVYANSSGVYTSLSKGTNGQTLIGSTGSTPAWANITSTGGSITITNGANSINLEATTPPSGTTVAFSAYANATVTNVTGDNTQYFYVCNTKYFDIGSNYNAGTGIFTAPSNGDYFFTATCSLASSTGAGSQTDYGYFGFFTSTSVDYIVYRGGTDIEINIFSPFNNFELCGSILIPMTAGMTIKPYVTVLIRTGMAPKVVNVVGGTGLLTSFTGFRLNT